MSTATVPSEKGFLSVEGLDSDEAPSRAARYLPLTEPGDRAAWAVNVLGRGSRRGNGVGQHIPTEPGLPRQVSSDTRLHVASQSH